MDIQDAIQQNPTLTDQQILDWLNNTVELSRSSVKWSYSGVVDTFGIAAAEGLLSAIKGAGLFGAADTYTGLGINLSLQATQDNLTAIATAVPSLASVCNALKSIGVTHGLQWTLFCTNQPMLTDVTAARAALVNQQAITQFCNEQWNPAIASGQTKSQLKTIVAGW